MPKPDSTLSVLSAGQKYWRLTLLCPEKTNSRRSGWRCACQCGSEIVLASSQITSGHNRSCGCTRYSDISKATAADLSNQRFGRLLIQHRVFAPNRGSAWICLCDCGAECKAKTDSLLSKKKQSCGCLERESRIDNMRRAARNPNRKIHREVTHGLSKTPEFKVWQSMKDRCFNSKSHAYARYGGRCITVCQWWKESFKAFYDDMGQRPSEEHTIDRIDNNGSYSCGNCDECAEKEWKCNCRWSLAKEQIRNSTACRMLTWNGVTRPVTEWAELTGLSSVVIRGRAAWGWPVDLILATPRGVLPPDLKQRRGPVDPHVKEMAYAVAAVSRAVKQGKLKRPIICQWPGCTVSEVQAHHAWGYARENHLRVQWLCRKHHREVEGRESPVDHASL